MEATREPHATLVDLIDRILEKGLVIHADVIISVAGIPLIGVNLRAALAGMETMLQYGMMQPWDERTRAWERQQRKKREISLTQGEELILKMFGSYYYSKGIYTAWRSGFFYLTDKRLLLYYSDFAEVIFQTPLEEIRGIRVKEMDRPVARGKREELFLWLHNGKIARLHAQDVSQLTEAIEKRLTEMGLVWEENPLLPEPEKRPPRFLTEGEEILCKEKIWYLMPCSSPGGFMSDTWRPGTLVLTNRKLYWQHSLEERMTFGTPIEEIVAVVLETGRAGGILLKRGGILNILYGTEGTRGVASFSGKALEEWEKVLKKIIAHQGVKDGEREIETCPQCDQEGLTAELLAEGCTKCGWVSPRPERRLAEAAVLQNS